MTAKGKYTLLAGIGCFVIYLLPQIIYAFSFMIISSQSGIPLDELVSSGSTISILQFIASVPIVLFGIYVFRNDFKEGAKGLKKLETWFYIGGGVVACFALSFITNLIYNAFGIQSSSENQALIESILLSNAAIPMIISVIFLAPICEEILFRKVIFGVCEDTLKLKPVVPIIISTLIFAGIHVLSDDIIFIFQYLPLAFSITFAYYLSKRNILVPIAIHFVNNLVSVVMVYVYAWIIANMPV